MTALPTVSLLVATRNEERHIEGCLQSILSQDYPIERLTVWVLDGCSEDNTRELARKLFAGRRGCHLVENLGITQSAGWNLGLSRSDSEVVGIVSAHSELDADYVSIAVETLHRTGADMVGGPARAQSSGWLGRAVALATTSRFGIGNARFHYATVESEVDTVFMGVCRRDVYERIGGFDEEMVKDQDDEFSYRLLSAGGRIVCNPAIRSRYFNRANIRTLWRQYYLYGFWKIRVMQKHPGQIRVRQLVPGTFVLALLFCTLIGLGLGTWRPLAALTGGYTATAILASATAGRKDWSAALALPLCFATLHAAYGVGSILGAVKFRRHWRPGARPPSSKGFTRSRKVS